MAVIFGGMVTAFIVLLVKLPAGLSPTPHRGGRLQKLEAVDFSFDVKQRYTFWSGLLGGLFLSLSYFGTDQSQVQRYISGASLRESRLGLMFNAVCKIPMQFFILLLGVMVFVFYQFEQPPVFFNEAPGNMRSNTIPAPGCALEQTFRDPRREGAVDSRLARRQARRQPQAEPPPARRRWRRRRAARPCAPRPRPRAHAADPRTKTNDADYVFITFILDYLPHGVIGLLVAAFFAAALSSKAAELNALGSTTTIDFYRHVFKREASDAHYVAASKWFTAFWGLVALAFALFANLVENLIQAVNIVGSVFYGVVLGLCSWWRFSSGGSAAPRSSGRRWRPRRWSSSSIFRSTSATSGTTSSAAPPACCSAVPEWRV
jgi:SSS family solute:Na+ symporter